jgi:hypothetical protein
LKKIFEKIAENDNAKCPDFWPQHFVDGWSWCFFFVQTYPNFRVAAIFHSGLELIFEREVLDIADESALIGGTSELCCASCYFATICKCCGGQRCTFVVIR